MEDLEEHFSYQSETDESNKLSKTEPAILPQKKYPTDFSIPTISEREVLEIIKSLPSNVATGLDGISSLC